MQRFSNLEVAVIAPTSLLEILLDERSIHMALAHKVLSDPEYREFYAQRQSRITNQYRSSVYDRDPRKQFVILDNSLMENGHQALSLSDVLKACELIHADEIVLPDAFRDFQANKDLFEEGLLDVHNYEHRTDYRMPRIAGVVQGSTHAELLSSFSWMAERADTICIPKVVDDIWTEDGRYGFIKHLHTQGLLSTALSGSSTRHRDKEIHLLGIWTSPVEIFKVARDFGFYIRSVDSALPVHAGLAGHRFHNRYGLEHFDETTGKLVPANKAKRPVNYLDMPRVEISDKMLDNIKYNIHVLDTYAEGADFNDPHDPRAREHRNKYAQEFWS